MTSGHFIIMCRQCQVVVSQCRCISLSKPVTYVTCPTCSAKN